MRPPSPARAARRRLRARARGAASSLSRSDENALARDAPALEDVVEPAVLGRGERDDAPALALALDLAGVDHLAEAKCLAPLPGVGPAPVAVDAGVVDGVQLRVIERP